MNQLSLPLTRKGRKLARPPPPKEHAIQIVVVQHLRTRAEPGWYWFHPANGEHRDKRTAAKLKAMGVMPGVPDLVFFAPDGTFRCLELKRRGRAPSPDQKAFLANAATNGWLCAWTSDLDEALRILEGWGALRANNYKQGPPA
jgi:hypothetical protein